MRRRSVSTAPTLQTAWMLATATLLAMTASVTATASPTPFDPLGESMPQFSTLVRRWIVWLMVIGLTSIPFALKHTAARWVLGAYVANHSVAMGTGWLLGADALSNGLVSVTHVVFWTPAVVVLIMGLRTINRASLYGGWHMAALATMVVSLLFDYRDSYVYLFTSPVT